MATAFPPLEGKYEILEKLHEGGMGAIYKVRHRLLDEVRVIKVMRPQHEADEGLRARFLREAQMAVRLRHPHIAQMYDFAFDDTGRGFIVMEFVDGISLQQLLERTGPPSLGLSLELARQSLTALAFLHRKGIVHRDISPDNIMATRDDDGRPLVKLIDLGIAKVMTGETGLTQQGTFLGKLRYASPEHFGAPGTQVDQRSDIYSFGVVLYELLTGTHPFPGTTPREMIAGHLVKDPLDFATTDPRGRAPEAVRASLLRALAKDPTARFATATDFDRELAAAQVGVPAGDDELTRALFDDSPGPTRKLFIPKPGSTQDRLNAQFGLATTPRPGTLPPAGTASSTDPTMLAPPGDAAPGTAHPVAAPHPDPAGPPPPPPAPGSVVGTQVPASLATIIPPATVPPIPPAAPAGPTGAPVAAPVAGARTGRRPRWPILAAAGVIVVAAGAAFLGRGLFRAAPAVTPSPPVVVATQAPVPTAEAVVTPTAAPVAVPAAVSRADFDRALRAGRLDQVGALLAALPREQREAIEGAPEGKATLDLARRAVETNALMVKAMKAKDPAATLQHAAAVIALVPAATGAADARATAAAALEAEADALAGAGRHDDALARLQAIRQAWPDRPGLAARMASLSSVKEADQRFATVLAAAAAAESERRPEKGLEALAQVAPDSRWQERVATVRARLEALLAELDKAPPVIRLKPGLKLDYSKGKPAVVQVVVTDDYRVKSVEILARREDTTEFQPLTVTGAGGNEYSAEIGPEFHANRTIEFYVTAADFAGHTSQLAGPTQPLRIKKRWLF